MHFRVSKERCPPLHILFIHLMLKYNTRPGKQGKALQYIDEKKESLNTNIIAYEEIAPNTTKFSSNQLKSRFIKNVFKTTLYEIQK